MNKFKKIYLNLCKKIYSVGRLEFDEYQISKNYQNATVQEKTIFYTGSTIYNPSNDKSKIKIGVNCHIYGSLNVLPYGGCISFGDNCSLGDHSRIVSVKGIYIGDRVMIAHNVNILDNNSHPRDAKMRHDDFINNYSGGTKTYDLEGKEIIIEDDVSIGFNSTILKGVTIGKGSIIAPGSMVVRNVPPNSIVFGHPAKVVWKIKQA